jgi:hypothetical protein
MRRPRLSIARLMAGVVIVTLDCAALRAAFPVLDLVFLVIVPVLEVGLFRMVSRRGRLCPLYVRRTKSDSVGSRGFPLKWCVKNPGRQHSRFWVGFEAFGWSAVLVYAAGLRRPLNAGFGLGLIGAIRLCTPHLPGVARWLDFLFPGDGLPLGLLLMAALLGSPMLLLALLGGLLAGRVEPRRLGGTPTASPTHSRRLPSACLDDGRLRLHRLLGGQAPG